MIAIRKAKLKDVLQIQKLFYKTWMNTYPSKEVGITTKDIKEYMKNRFTQKTLLSRRQFMLETRNDNTKFTRVATINHKVVGLAFAEVEKDYIMLRSIYVLPRYQRLGVGKLLMTSVLNAYPDAKEFRLNVATYNSKAIAFYERQGFVGTGKIFTEERHRMPVSKVCIPELEMVYKRST